MIKKYYENYHRHLREVFDPDREQQRLSAIKKFKKSGRLLDVGAGRGYFVKVVGGDRHFQATGLDISLAACRYAKKHFNLNLVCGTLASIPETKKFDIITFHSTLEHLLQPLKALEQAVFLLKPGGLLVFSVPNFLSFEYYWSKILFRPYSGWLIEHLYYFTPESVNKILTKLRLKPLLITSRHYSPLEAFRWHPYWLIVNLAKRILEYTDIGGRLCFGNVIYVYAQKPD